MIKVMIEAVAKSNLYPQKIAPIKVKELIP
jgi:hypothetical protein